MNAHIQIPTCCLLLAFLAAGTCPAEDEKPQPARGVHVTTPAPAAGEGDESPNARVERLLQARIDIVAKKKPLEMVEAIGGAVGVEIEIRPGAAGKWPYQNEAAAWNMRTCTAEAVLDLLLLRVSSSWTIHEGRIVVFPRYEEDRWMATETLPIDDLVELKPEWMSERQFVDDLIKCITNTVAPADSDSLEDSFRLRRAGSKQATLELTATPARRRRAHRALDAIRTAPTAKRPVVRHPFDARNKALRAALDKPVTLEVEDMELSALVEEISRQIGVPINLDLAALGDMGIGDDAPITFACRAIRASDVLARVNRDLKLTAIIHGGTVAVTTRDQAESLLSTVVFDVGDMTLGEGKSENVDTLIECLIRTIQPITWNNFGGKAAISPLRLEGRTFLVVSHDQDALDEIATLLDAMRRVQGEKAKVMTEWHDEAVAFGKALEKEVTWHFADTPLENVVVTVAKSLDIPVFLDRHALDNMGITRDSPISLPSGTYTARDALWRALHNDKLGVKFEYGGLTITTCSEVEDRFEFAVYDLSDLVSADNAHADADSLIGGILSSVERMDWGYFAFSSPERTTLVISDTPGALEEIARLLDALRTIAATKAKVLIIESEKEAAVRKALVKRVEWTFKDVSLPEAMKKIAADLKVAVYVDEVSLDASRINPEGLRGSLSGIRCSAADALDRVLGPHKLDFIIANGALAVVTGEDAQRSCFYETRIYDVTDLVAPGKVEPDGLAAAIRAYIAPRTGRHGTESVEPIALPDGQTVLVIRHERRVQEEIQQQLEALRK